MVSRSRERLKKLKWVPPETLFTAVATLSDCCDTESLGRVLKSQKLALQTRIKCCSAVGLCLKQLQRERAGESQRESLWLSVALCGSLCGSLWHSL